MKGNATDCHMLHRMIREIKVPRDRLSLDASLSSFSTSRRCSRNRSPSRLPVSQSASYAVDDIRLCHTAAILSRETKKALFYHA